MREIKLLSQETIDKIAAGEVVERPASVIKELVENSIDAGSTAITVEIIDGGLTYMRVTDNGCGIPATELSTAFLRHSTSKIRDSKDLDSICSLGFRGEALSSIAAVAKVEVITKPKEQFIGASYVIEDAKEISLSEIGAPDGTTIIVSHLFDHVPARKKFLKTAATETSYIADVIEHLALSNPQISFRFISNKKEKINSYGNGRLNDAIYQLFGKEISSNLLDIEGAMAGLKVSGYIGKSNLARGNRSFQYLFVNGRYIKSNLISKAIEEGYYGFMMQHQFPVAFLFLEFDEGLVDVNVHPTKQEVRFSNSLEVASFITKLVNERLSKREDIEVAIVPEPVVAENQPVIEKSISSKTEIEKPIFEPFETEKISSIKDELFEKLSIESEESFVSVEKVENEMPSKIEYVQQSFLSEEAVKEHRIIGQAFDTYWIIEYDGAVYFVDQHAAHEKVLFEQTMTRLKDNRMTSQRLSPSIVISLNQVEANILEEYMEDFNSIGFEISHFGDNDYTIDAVPGNMLGIDSKELFMEILADCNSIKVSNSHDLIIEKVASMSCKAAVKGHDKLSFREADALIKELLTLENPYHCPHGRPTMIKMTQSDLERKFKRIV